jgi:hypothetical protein
MSLETSYAWCAGLIDGEGCISIYRVRKGPYYAVMIRVVMTNRETIERVAEILACGTIRHNTGVGVRRDSWTWCCASIVGSKLILRRLRPYLVTKAKEADLAIEFLNLDKAGRRLYGEKLLNLIHQAKLKSPVVDIDIRLLMEHPQLTLFSNN